MFGLFKSATVDDPQFGVLTHTKGMWRGAVTLTGASPVPLVLAGDKSAPDAAALAAARIAVSSYAGWQPAIAAALREHAEPYAEEEPLDLASDAALWSEVSMQYVAVTALRGVLTTEIGYAATWDEEHTLGARLRDGHLVELNGSVLAP